MKKPIIKVAKNGYDIRTANPKDLTIDSTKNTLKLFNIYTGQVDTTSPNYWNDVYITHNLGYQPYVELYYNIDGEVDDNGNSIWKKAPNLKYKTEPDMYITEEVSIQRPDNNQLRGTFLSGDFVAGIGTPATFNYICRIYINAWEGSWYE